MKSKVAPYSNLNEYRSRLASGFWTDYVEAECAELEKVFPFLELRIDDEHNDSYFVRGVLKNETEQNCD